MNTSNKIINIYPNVPTKEIVNSYIMEAAYYKAEKRGFEQGFEQQDWLEAEEDIKRCLNGYFDQNIHSTYN